MRISQIPLGHVQAIIIKYSGDYNDSTNYQQNQQQFHLFSFFLNTDDKTVLIVSRSVNTCGGNLECVKQNRKICTVYTARNAR
jgi:hypothetical protein